MSDNFCDIFDHGMDLELRNFVRDFLVLVANYGKSRIEKEEEKKKYLMDLPPNSHYFVCLFCFVFVFLFFWGVDYASIMVSFVIMIRNSLIQMQVLTACTFLYTLTCL